MGRVAIGLVIGFVAGWATFAVLEDGADSTRGRSSERRARESDSGGVTPLAENADSSVKGVPARGDEQDEVTIIKEGTVQEIRRLAHAENGLSTDGWLEAIRLRLPQARERGNWRLFECLLRVAARIGTVEAHGLLLEVIGEERLRFPRPMGQLFYDGLKDAELPGIAAAVQRRIEFNVEHGENSWTGISGWAELVAHHGDSGECKWLLESPACTQFARHAREALARSDNPAAMELVVAGLRASFGVRGTDRDSFDHRCLARFAEHSPNRTLELFEEFVSDPGRDRSMTTDQARLLGRLANRGSVARIEALLAAARSRHERLTMCYAIEGLSRAGLDIGGVGHLLEEPVALLERVATEAASEEDMRLASKARYAIEYNRVLWSERAAAALSAAGYAKEAAKVRAGFTSEWRTD